MTIKIEKGIPVADRNYVRSRISYPFKDMKIGDSFMIKTNKKNHTSKRGSLVSAAIHYSKTDKTFHYVTRTVEGGIRLWRVK